MTQVIIHTRDAGSTFVSRWQCGTRTGEVTTVAADPSPVVHPRVLAELLALSYLVVNKKLIGLDAGVTPVTFHVSEPAVIDAVKTPDAIPALRLRSRALRARFGDSTFDIGAMPPPLLPGAERTLLLSDQPIDWSFEVAGETVIVTEHAVKQVQHRHAFKTRGYAFRFIQRWSKRKLRDAALPAAVVADKLNKYAAPGAIKCDDTGWHGIVVNRTLVTMFHRDPQS